MTDVGTAILILAGTMSAATVCGRHDVIVDKLLKSHEEHRVGVGLAVTGGIIEVFSSERDNSFTILMTMPGGPTCFMATGHFWENIEPPLEGDDL